MKKLSILFFFIINQTFAQKIDEQVYISLNQESFSFSDSIAFEVSIMAKDVFDQSHVVYVELISPEKDLVLEKTFRIYDRVKSVFKIDSSFERGEYYIRAYTNYLAGLGKNAVFKRKITIEDISNTNPKGSNISIGIEGGKLINELPGMLSISTQFPNITGQIIDDEGTEILAIKTDNEGSIIETLAPKENKTYRLALKVNEREFQYFEIPKAESSGISMIISQKDTEINTKLYSVGVNSDSLTLLIYQENELIEIQHFKNKIVNIIKIKSLMLPSGLLQFVVLDDFKNKVAERLWLNESTETLENEKIKYTSVNFYLESTIPTKTLSVKKINNLLINSRLTVFKKSTEKYEKEQFLTRTGIAYNLEKEVIRNEDITLNASSKAIGIQKITTNINGYFSFGIVKDYGFVELQLRDNKSQDIYVRWVPRNVLAWDEDGIVSKATIATSGLDLPMNDNIQLNEVQIKSSVNFDDVKRKAGMGYFNADKSIDGDLLMKRNFGNFSPLAAISASYPNMKRMINRETNTEWLYRFRGNEYQPITITIDGVLFPIGSDLPYISSIYRVEMRTTGMNFGAYIYTKSISEVFGEKKNQKKFNGNALVKGFDNN